MAIIVLNEDIGVISTVGTVSIETKQVLVTYEVEYESSSYFVDVLVTYRQNMASGNRFLYLMKMEDTEINFDRDMNRSKLENIYDGVRDGVGNHFPALNIDTVLEIAEELTEMIRRRLGSFAISTRREIF